MLQTKKERLTIIETVCGTTHLPFLNPRLFPLKFLPPSLFHFSEKGLFITSIFLPLSLKLPIFFTIFLTKRHLLSIFWTISQKLGRNRQTILERERIFPRRKEGTKTKDLLGATHSPSLSFAKLTGKYAIVV